MSRWLFWISISSCILISACSSSEKNGAEEEPQVVNSEAVAAPGDSVNTNTIPAGIDTVSKTEKYNQTDSVKKEAPGHEGPK